jgi:hypothetical protein
VGPRRNSQQTGRNRKDVWTQSMNVEAATAERYKSLETALKSCVSFRDNETNSGITVNKEDRGGC